MIGVFDLEHGLLRAEHPRTHLPQRYYRPLELLTIGAGRYFSFCTCAPGVRWRAAVWVIEEGEVLLESSEGREEHGDEIAVTPDGSLALRFEAGPPSRAATSSRPASGR